MLERIFRRHGAVHVGIPLLMPKCSLYDANDAYVCLMDQSGGLVGLPYDSRVMCCKLPLYCNCLLTDVNSNVILQSNTCSVYSGLDCVQKTAGNSFIFQLSAVTAAH